MAALMKRMKNNPDFPLIVAGASYTMLTLTSAVCLYIYFSQIASNDFWHWQLISYVIMLANGISGYSEFFDEESFCPLRDLLDYSQVVLVLPCYAAQMWIKNEMGPPEISAIHAGLGIVALVMYIMFECKRPDLSDLAMFANAISLIFMAGLMINPFSLLATVILLAGYYVYKRDEDQCCLAPQDKFNFVMAAFAGLSLASFDDNLLQTIQDTVNGLISGGE